MHAFLNIAYKAATEAGRLMVKAQERLDTLTISEKGRNNFVSDVDQNAEKIIVEILRQAYPNHGILAEEGGEHCTGDEYQWIIDPLDGTTNYIHGLPHFCISMALLYRGKLAHGLIYDPVRDESFSASQGAGSFCNDRRRLRVTDKTNLNGTLLCAGSPKYADDDDQYQQQLGRYLATLQDLYPKVAGIRRAGSAALDLAYVAAGRYDGYWETGLSSWDIAAGALIVKEAGGLAGDFNGDQHFLETGSIVATSAKLFKPLLQTVHRHHASVPSINTQGL